FKVTDDSGDPAGGIKVTFAATDPRIKILDPESQREKNVFTSDENGFARIGILAPGEVLSDALLGTYVEVSSLPEGGEREKHLLPLDPVDPVDPVDLELELSASPLTLVLEVPTRVVFQILLNGVPPAPGTPIVFIKDGDDVRGIPQKTSTGAGGTTGPFELTASGLGKLSPIRAGFVDSAGSGETVLSNRIVFEGMAKPASPEAPRTLTLTASRETLDFFEENEVVFSPLSDGKILPDGTVLSFLSNPGDFSGLPATAPVSRGKIKVAGLVPLKPGGPLPVRVKLGDLVSGPVNFSAATSETEIGATYDIAPASGEGNGLEGGQISLCREYEISFRVTYAGKPLANFPVTISGVGVANSGSVFLTDSSGIVKTRASIPRELAGAHMADPDYVVSFEGGEIKIPGPPLGGVDGCGGGL
ncbi:MAG: hypothetical protein LBF41_08595, partial [Deltaproteobacteria bacterium]|nr:hypothetical protein [Deltaproteobacteria bacterium]